jgi:two-component system, NarL family, sensor kinase
MEEQQLNIILTIALSTVTVFSLSIAIILLSHRFLKQQQQKQNEMFKAILEAQEKEKERVARDLHDQVGPLLSGLKFNIDLFQGDSDVKTFKAANAQMINTIIDDLRTASYDLMPKVLYTFGLIDAIEDCCQFFAKSTNIEIVFTNEIEGKIQIEEYKQIHVFRAVQEIMNNAIKYSNAQTIKVNTLYKHGQLEVKIADNGKGFDRIVVEKNKGTGIGLKNITGRMKLIAASCELNTAVGSGTTYLLRIPVGIV